MIDCNAFNACRDPFRPWSPLEADWLSGKLARFSLTAILMSSLDAVFQLDAPGWDIRLLGRSQSKWNDGRHLPRFYVAVTVNPSLRKWQEQLTTAMKAGNPRAVKVHPNYHQYPLRASCALELLAACASAELPVIVQMRLQDVRSQSALMQVPDVGIDDVLEAAAAVPQAKVVLGGVKWGEVSSRWREIGGLHNVWIDISQCEVIDVLRRLINLFGADKLLFGTHAPFFSMTSALLKLDEARLDDEERRRVTHDNATRLFRL